MIKSELISRIAEQNPHLFAKDVEKIVNTILDEIVAALIRRERADLPWVRDLYHKELFAATSWAKSLDQRP
jgi:Bacterial DNA-binding protein